MQPGLPMTESPRDMLPPQSDQGDENVSTSLDWPGSSPRLSGQRAAEARTQADLWRHGQVAQSLGNAPRRALVPMSRATPPMRSFAKRLIAYEALVNSASAAQTPLAFHVCDRLRPPLTTLMGSGGFRAVFSRALTLAKAEVPWLRTVRVKLDGSLEGLEELHAQLDPNRYREVRVVLVAQLLGLLVAFIGETLTLHLVGEVWPRAPLDDLSAANEEKNRKTA